MSGTIRRLAYAAALLLCAVGALCALLPLPGTGRSAPVLQPA